MTKKLIGKITDPKYPEQWNLKMLHVPEAWAYTLGEGVEVGIIDTGIDASHRDLGWNKHLYVSSGMSDAVIDTLYAPVHTAIMDYKHPKIRPGHNFVKNSSVTYDKNRHGTYMAGIIGAEMDGFGMVGIAPCCKMRAYVVLNEKGKCPHYGYIADAIATAQENGCKVINMSLAGWYQNDLLEQTINHVTEKGCIVIAATGNSNVDRIAYPAAYKNVLAVGGCDAIGQRWIHSGFRGSNYGDGVDCVCPADPQMTTRKMRSRFASIDATSMACANMSGVVALLKSLNPVLTLAGLRDLIQKYSSRNYSDAECGYGVPNVLEMAKSLSGGIRTATKNECLDKLDTVHQLLKSANKNIFEVKTLMNTTWR
jgi:serine protease